MNFGWIDFPQNLTEDSFHEWLCEINKFYTDFNETCAQIIKNWIKNGGKIVCSDWALNNYQQGLADIFGIERLGGIPPIFFDLDIDWVFDGFEHDHEWGCIPAGNVWWNEIRIDWDWYHKIGITSQNPITNEYFGSILKSKSWAFDIKFYSDFFLHYCDDVGNPEILSYYYKPLGFFSETLDYCSPAIVISNYDDGKGVYFSMDIGRSSYIGYNSSAWIQLCLNSLKWLSFSNDTPIIAITANPHPDLVA